MFIFVFTDGRDTDPNSSIKFIRKLESNLFGAKIASISEDIMLWIEITGGKEQGLHMT